MVFVIDSIDSICYSIRSILDVRVIEYLLVYASASPRPQSPRCSCEALRTCDLCLLQARMERAWPLARTQSPCTRARAHTLQRMRWTDVRNAARACAVLEVCARIRAPKSIHALQWSPHSSASSAARLGSSKMATIWRKQWSTELVSPRGVWHLVGLEWDGRHDCVNETWVLQQNTVTETWVLQQNTLQESPPPRAGMPRVPEPGTDQASCPEPADRPSRRREPNNDRASCSEPAYKASRRREPYYDKASPPEPA